VTPSTQCTAWQTFAGQIQAAAVYSSITLKGSNDATGHTCTGAFANTLCQALRTDTPVPVTACNGHSWSYSQSSCAGTRELDADGYTCSCSSQYAVRACISNLNWGGVAGATCNAGSQTLTVTCTP
jgi:hypothetical protein